MTGASPFLPPRLPEGPARLLSRLSRRLIDIPLRLGGTTLRLCPDLAAARVIDPEDEICAPREGVGISLDAAGDNWRVQVGGLVAEALLSPPEGLTPEDIPLELRPALWALTLEPLLDQASAALGRKLTLLAVETAQDNQAATAAPYNKGAAAAPYNKDATAAPRKDKTLLLPFAVSGDAGRPAGSGSLILPLSTSALSLLAAAGNAFPRRPGANTASIMLSLSLCAGHEYFPVRLLREAAPGDVLQYALPAAPEAPLTLEVNSRALWTAALADGTVTVKGVLFQELNRDAKDMTMTSPVSDAAPAGALSAAEIDALEVRLTLELDERLISVGELAALAPGHTLETTASLAGPVTLKVNGRAVGKGRLVEVGDRLGVMIVSLALEPDRGTASPAAGQAQG
ncbi:MAG: type III secretion system cytoplasmic ring protein SctQ [Deltaproteobacteria bacterium]|jgi:type III secretion protein Q|nr:type III secretion system cytoplasmic ring protein SctQ [Deltaproteobacteria bacterium]